MNKEFKVGDKVYAPFQSTRVLTVRDGSNPEYTIVAGDESFKRDGRRLKNDVLPSIFHATPENHALLEQLHGVEFEKPPVKPTSREIIEAMLARGHKDIPCWVSNIHQNPNSSNTWAFIYSVSNDFFIDRLGASWDYATPFDPVTSQPITELPE